MFRLANATQPPSHVVVEPPLVPDSSDWKKRVAIGVLGAVLGLLLGLALAGLAELGDPTFTNKALVRRCLGLDVLTVIPASTPAQVLALMAATSDSAGSNGAAGPRSALRTLAARLVSAFPDAAAGSRRGRSVLVTSARAGEGKSLVANGLAVQMSCLGYGRILLVDAVPRGESPAPQLQLAASVKTTFAGGQWSASEEEIDSISSLSVMTATDSRNGARALNDRTLYPLLEQASGRFDWIIFDGGCLDDGDVSRLSHVVDAMLLVVDAPRTRRQVVRDSLGTLPVMSGRLTGVILNNVRREIPDFLYNRV
jgi:Mrp family chromosome partitioning ATPase